MTVKDYYAILGVLPGAEDIVVIAAYRALSSRYHPDRWSGDPQEAHDRMAELNEAIAVLRNPARRAEYDRKRSAESRAEFVDEPEQDCAFSAALGELSDRWSIACELYPALEELRVRLNVISKALAFNFVVLLLETKAYSRHRELAALLEAQFLQRYFGENPVILKYARALIFAGKRGEARDLNRVIKVMGSDVEPTQVFSYLERKWFDIQMSKFKRTPENKALAEKVLADGRYDTARELAKKLGYTVDDGAAEFTFRPNNIVLLSPTGRTLNFDSGISFVDWIRAKVAKHLV